MICCFLNKNELNLADKRSQRICVKFNIVFFLTALLHLNLILSKAQGQTEIFSRLEHSERSHGEVKITQDSSVLDFLYYHLQTQQKQQGIKGYRISIFRDTGQDARKNCMAVRSRFKSKYDTIRCHETFVYPYYKLYVGDFRTESEALKFLRIIERDFPNAFIVRNIAISYPDLE